MDIVQVPYATVTGKYFRALIYAITTEADSQSELEKWLFAL